MPATASILSLGTRTDAETWRQGVAGLGATIVHDVRSAFPTIEQIRTFFAGSEEWLFIAGHFNNGELYNEAHHQGNAATALRIAFANDLVTVRRGTDPPVTLTKGAEFSQHSSANCVFWGGCNTNSDVSQVNNLRALFGNHTLIGWKGITGWQILNVVMGRFWKSST